MHLLLDFTKHLQEYDLTVRVDTSASRIGILGASGCGKSMTLKSIAGIVRPDAGKICVDGDVFFDSGKKLCVRPQKRNVGYLFQNYALFPTMTVEENVLAGLENVPKKERRERCAAMIARFHLAGLEKRYPGELSGGQQQRVALARLLAGAPKMILLVYPSLCLLVMNIGIGALLSAMYVFFEDTSYLYDVLLTLINYMSVIFYSIDSWPTSQQRMFLINPIYVYIKYFRTIVIDGVVPSPMYHLLCLFYALFYLIAGMLVYRKYNHEFLYYL